MESIVPGLTRACLLEGSAYTGLPASLVGGLSSGQVEIWAPSHDAKTPLFRSAPPSTATTTQNPQTPNTTTISTSPVTRVRSIYPQGANNSPVLLSTDSAGCLAEHIVVPAEKEVKLETVSEKRLHRGAATDVAVCRQLPMVASCGEDGVVQVLQLAPDDIRPLQAVTLDSATMNALAFLDQHQVAAVGASPGAQMIFYDRREAAPTEGNGKVTKFGQVGREFCSVAVHPSRPDRVCTGANDGSLSVWDRRTNTILSCLSNAHASDVMLWNLCFHPTNPNILLSAGEDGLVQSYDISRPDPATTKAGVYSTKGLAIHSLDTCYDDLAGEIVMIGSDDECLVMEQLYKLLQD